MTEDPADRHSREILDDWSPRPAPNLAAHSGRFVRVARFDGDRDRDGLFEAIGEPNHPNLWEFIPIGPFESAEALRSAIDGLSRALAWTTYVFRFADSGQIGGMATLMNTRAEAGVTEVGWVIYGPALQRTSAATEAMAILCRHVFEDLGYRRFEWKCDARNDASRRAALRYGFVFEGLFRQHMIVRGRNRDTAWYAMTDGDWPARRLAFDRWLDEANFDEVGAPRWSLAALREEPPES
jgi:RimJ/RimL family protein N-acetyltransferase